MHELIKEAKLELEAEKLVKLAVEKLKGAIKKEEVVAGIKAKALQRINRKSK